MYEAIKNFNKQFLYKPVVENKDALVTSGSFIVVGMGGSALAAKLLKTWKPGLDITIRCDYGLPALSKEELKNKLIILSSYSGGTEECIDAFKKAKELGLNIAVISTGGELLLLAIENKVPYIKMPDTGIQPRSALGFSIKSFLKIMGEEEGLKTIKDLAQTLDPISFEQKGKELAQILKGNVPIIYSSTDNFPIAYNWKIKLNETGKIPAYCNVLPELNHNEMNGFDVKDSSRSLSSNFYFFILKDSNDDSRITKRMDVLEKLYKDRKLKVRVLDLEAGDIWYKIFSSLVLADWVAYHIALLYGLEPEQVPMVEEFKKLILK